MLDLSSASGNVTIPTRILQKIDLAGSSLSNLPNLSKYKDLKQMLGDYYSFNPDNIVIGNGSDAILERLAILFARKSSVTLTPTFGRLYEAPARYSKKASCYELRESSSFMYHNSEHIRFMKYLGRKNLDSVWICSPNNPTGAIIEKQYLEELVATHKNTVFIIDEVFMDFVPKQDNFSAKKLTELYDNIVVVNSFSKTWGFSGLRFGYCFSSSNTAKKIEGMSLMFDVSSVTADIALFCLEEPDYKQKAIAQMHTIRADLLEYFSGLSKIHLISHSPINLITLKLDHCSNDQLIGESSQIRIKSLSRKYEIPNSHYVRLKIPNSLNDLQFLKAQLKQYE